MGDEYERERSERELRDLVQELHHLVGTDRGISDAIMLRHVARAREALRDIDDLLEALEKYFTAGSS